MSAQELANYAEAYESSLEAARSESALEASKLYSEESKQARERESKLHA